jgi:hypothetical protein
LLTAAWLAAGVSIAAELADEGADGSRLYQGAWFDVRVPASFTARPSLESRTGVGYDSVELVAPDQSVSFYVFAPQWGGEPRDIALDPEHEVLVAERRQPIPNGEIRWYTIAAKEGGYRRSYRDTVEQQGAVRTVVGIKYRDEAALDRYRQAYEAFWRSLQTYAD